MKHLNVILALLAFTISLNAQTVDCDDFTSIDWTLNSTPEDTIGYSQINGEPIEVDNNFSGSVNDNNPGIYGIGGGVDFEFSNINQIATFEIYGFESQYNQMGFSVNGSAINYMDSSFPIVVNGVTVDLDTSAVDFLSWDNAYLIFSGVLDSIKIETFELGILSLCIEDDESCDDFTSSDWQISPSLYQGDTLGYSQDSTQLIMEGNNSNLDFGSPSDQYPGIGYLGTALFEFNNTNQTATFEIYGFEGQYNQMGFSVNGSTVFYMDVSFPLVVNGVTIDLDTTATDFSNWDNAFLSFSGVLDNIEVELFESGILSLCVEDNESLSNENNELSTEAFSVYPNPTMNTINISNNEPFEVVQIYSMSGELVLESNIITNSKSKILDISNLQKGLYILRIGLRDGTSKVSKVVKE